MIRIEDVSFRYSNSKDDALEHITLHIRKGEFVVLLGRKDLYRRSRYF